jgi:tRNA pseudouridine55 synthase
MGMQKEYTGTFTLGAVTPTYDLESEPVEIQDISSLSEEAIRKAVLPFIGQIQQTPPIHSAIKKDGKPVYLLARKGVDVVLEARTITIEDFAIEKIELPKVYFKVVCSTGTYIRSLANDYGKHLGCGAYLSSLRRTKIGDFLVSDALQIDALSEQIKYDAIKGGEPQTNIGA